MNNNAFLSEGRMLRLVVPQLNKWALLGVSGAIGASLAGMRLQNESKSVQVEQGVDPIPNQLTLNGEGFDLIGYGVRQVSFLKFKVYLLGVYIAAEDKPLLKRVFNSNYLESLYETGGGDHKSNLQMALSEAATSDLLWGNAISSGVKFTARICALRNTDMGHLRDGFIRTITNSPVYKSMKRQSEDKTLPGRIDSGLKELRDVFNSFKVSAKKNSNIFMEMNGEGGLDVKVEMFDGENHSDLRVLGTIGEPLIAQILFTSYIGSNKPLVQQVHETSLHSILSLF